MHVLVVGLRVGRLTETKEWSGLIKSERSGRSITAQRGMKTSARSADPSATSSESVSIHSGSKLADLSATSGATGDNCNHSSKSALAVAEAGNVKPQARGARFSGEREEQECVKLQPRQLTSEEIDEHEKNCHQP